MSDLRKLNHLRARNLGDELPGLLGIADLVLLALQRNPRIANASGGAVDEANLRARVVLESLAAAQRLAPVEVRAEAQRQSSLERADRRLGQRRVYDGGAGGVANEDRGFVALHSVFLLQEVRERLEGRGSVDAGLGSTRAVACPSG